MNLIRYISLGLLLFSLGIHAQGQNCPPFVVVTAPVLTGTNQTFQASNAVTGVSAIQSGATAVFDAGSEINLLSNFDVVAGANFDARIGGCSGNIVLPNDPYFLWQWGHYNTAAVPMYQFGVPVPQRPLGGAVDADADILEAWEITKGSPNITVALIDYGLDMNHPDFVSSRVTNGYNFVDGNSNYQDDFGHGTMVAGIVGATPNNGIGTAGIDWNCKLMPLKVGKTGNYPNDQRIASAVDHAALHGADIVSMSFGTSERMARGVEEAFRNGIDAGILFFAAAGNDNRNSMDYPSRYASIAGVGAMDACGVRKASVPNTSTNNCDRDSREDGVPNWGSNYGQGLDFIAPGTMLATTDVVGTGGYSAINIYQSDASGTYIFDSYGTSMSSPFAAGIASLVWAAKPGLKSYQVRKIMQQAAVATTGIGTGHGQVNARAAVEMAQSYNLNADLLPNLEVEILSAPANVLLNHNLNVTLRVKNRGDKVAQSSSLTYAIHYNWGLWARTYPGVVLPPQTLTIPALGPQQTYMVSISIPVEEPVCNGGTFFAGNYTLRLEVDPQNGVAESNEFNAFFHDFTVLPEIDLPDLIIENVSLQESKLGGLTLNYDIRNTQWVRATTPLGSGPQFISYYASADAILDGNDVALPNSPLVQFNLCPQLASTFSEQFANNSGYLIIQIDAGGRIAETNENNNTFAIAFPNSTKGGKSSKTISMDKAGFSIQIIPNPVSQEGRVKYTLERNSEVAVSIFDMLGTQVQAILPNVKQEAGTFEIPFYKSGLSSGIYLVEIEINGNRFIEKLLIQ